MLLLRVSFFNELENKNDTFESKALILRETPFDFIVGRKTIERYNCGRSRGWIVRSKLKGAIASIVLVSYSK